MYDLFNEDQLFILLKIRVEIGRNERKTNQLSHLRATREDELLPVVEATEVEREEWTGNISLRSVVRFFDELSVGSATADVPPASPLLILLVLMEESTVLFPLGVGLPARGPEKLDTSCVGRGAFSSLFTLGGGVWIP